MLTKVKTPWREALREVLATCTGSGHVPNEVLDIVDSFIEVCVIKSITEVQALQRKHPLPHAQA